MHPLAFQPSRYNSDMQEAQITLPNQQTIHVEIGGNPAHPSILLIMGLGAQVLFWPDAFCRQLIQAGFQVIRYDNRDIGLSSKIKPSKSNRPLNFIKMMARFSVGLHNHGAPYTLYDMAEDASQLIQQLNLKDVHVIGASMGGMIAQILAAQHPEQVKSLGLLFTSANLPFQRPPYPKQLYALIARPKSADPEMLIQHAVKVFDFIGTPKHQDRILNASIVRELYQRSHYPVGAIHHFAAILCTGSLLELDKQIQQPTIVLHGSADKLLPPSHGRAVAKAIKNSKFELIQGMAHDLPDYYIPSITQKLIQHIFLHNR